MGSIQLFLEHFEEDGTNSMQLESTSSLSHYCLKQTAYVQVIKAATAAISVIKNVTEVKIDDIIAETVAKGGVQQQLSLTLRACWGSHTVVRPASARSLSTSPRHDKNCHSKTPAEAGQKIPDNIVCRNICMHARSSSTNISYTCFEVNHA